VRSIPAHYEKEATAAEYRRRFSKSLARRLSNRLELRMAIHALGDVGRSDAVLDVPCGAGRLVPALLPRVRKLVCVDVARAMLGEARSAEMSAAQRSERSAARPIFVRASVFDLPFPNAAFDVAVCWRLLQHFADGADRRKLILELARVARRAVVLSFWDAGTFRGRRIMRRPRKPYARVALHRSELVQEIESCGLKAESFYRLFGLFSPVAAVRIRIT
jgi:ubiquinone/menaquinone biosynthesis C-methylase UbiE